VSARREEIVAALQAHPVVIVCGETGSGKTTQLPKMLLEAGALRRGMLGHTQPRRIAARAVATRLAAEIPEAPPRFVAHKVRFNDGTSPATAIKVMTDGILLAEARGDPRLSRYDALIIDEAHERSLNIDLLLGFLKGLITRRRDLKLVITSATIEPQRFAAYFGGAPVIEVSGRSFPVETRYRPLEADADEPFDPGLTAGILTALEEISAEPGDLGRGDVLVFLPGEREIREAAEALEQTYGDRLEVLPLYSRLAFADQQRVFERRGRRRVVLATNVAETSLTVPGIRAVIDSGLARIARYSARSKLLRLPIEPISQASAAQRQGRCGRVSEGLCIRLYSEDDFNGRPLYTPPEVLRTNLASVILQMESLRLGSPVDFPFLDPPDTRLINDGYRLLQELEAVGPTQAITEVGRVLARLPVDPRLGRMLVAARPQGCLTEVIALAAVLSLQDPRERPSDRQAAADAAHAEGADPRSDFMTLLALRARYQEARAARSRNALRRWCANAFLSAARMREWEELETQLRQIIEELGWQTNERPATPEAIHRALLSGLLSHLGEKTERGDFIGARGRRFQIAPGTPLRNRSPKWLMAAQLVETERVYARVVAAIDPQWVEAAARHLVKREYTDPEWDEVRGVVHCRESVSLYGLLLVSGRRVNYGQVAPTEAREIFVREALVGRRSRLRARFLDHHQSVKRALLAEEAALRRHVILVDESVEVDWYLERIPSTVHSLAAFERWRREAEREAPDVLCIEPAALRRPDAPDVDRTQLPEVLRLAGNTLPVSYHFDPQSPRDGATVQVPEPLLAKLAHAELHGLVPGWRLDKITALIRGLPKALRRPLVPAPDVARVAHLEWSREGASPTLAELAVILTRIGGQPVTRDDLARVELEPWLKLNLRVLDREGQRILEGRDLDELQRLHRRRVRDGGPRAPTATAISDPWERVDLRAFDWAVLPETVRVSRQGVVLDLHPTLIDDGQSVTLTLLADAADAQRRTRAGVLRLLAIGLEPILRQAQKLLASRRRLMLLHQPVGSAQGFVRALAERALERVCLPEGSPLPRTAEAFEAARERGRPELVAAAERLGIALETTLERHHEIKLALARIPEAVDGALREDVSEALHGLIHEGFVATTPDPWLDALPRYLKALGRRIEKLTDPRPTAVEAQYRLREARARRRAIEARWPREEWSSELLALRWWVEEYGIQLYAQEMKTQLPVSPKRLEAAFLSLEGSGGRR